MSQAGFKLIVLCLVISAQCQQTASQSTSANEMGNIDLWRKIDMLENRVKSAEAKAEAAENLVKSITTVGTYADI